MIDFISNDSYLNIYSIRLIQKNANYNKDFTYLSNSRQISLVKKAIEVSKNLTNSLNNDIPIDMLEIDIKEICEILGEIIGESYDDKLVDTLFSNFCLGK